eukprot:SM000247S08289  [mRNA]  locus=s247:94774:99683:- [translate_table: standard]
MTARDAFQASAIVGPLEALASLGDMMGPNDGRAEVEDGMESLVLDQTTGPAASEYRSSMTSKSTGSVTGSDPLSPELVSVPFEDDLVDPPSYADAISAPYSGEAQANGAPKRTGALSLFQSKQKLMITVSDPQKVVDPNSSLVPGGNTYFTYLVTTRIDISESKSEEVLVRRRFKDFVTLADRLAEGYRGYFIPPRPDKSVVESQVMQSKEFVEMRRLALERYLRRLAAHPVLRKAEELRIFLESPEKLPLPQNVDMASRMLDGAANLPRQLFGESSIVIQPKDAAQPAKGGRDLVRLFKELKQSVTNEWVGSKPASAEEDHVYIKKKEKLLDLEARLGEASQQAEAFTKSQQELGEVMAHLGMALLKLSKFEVKEATMSTTPSVHRVHAADCKRTGNAAIKISRRSREATAQIVQQLVQLHEYLGFMQGLHAAFTDRGQALLTVQTLSSDLASKKAKLEKLEAAQSKVFGGDKARIRRIAELGREVEQTEKASEAAQLEYNRIIERNRGEFERFEVERHADFHGMLDGFIRAQVAFADLSVAEWGDIAKEAAGLDAASDKAV